MPPHRLGFLRRFALKTGIHFITHFGLESGMVFEGTTECMSEMSKKERETNMRIRNGLNNFFSSHSNLSNDNILSA